MRTRAIIIKKQNTNEYDQMVTCYTEEFGKLTAVAKSVLKPGSIQSLHLDLFNLVDFDLISGRGMPIITGAQAENTYPNLKKDLSRLAAAYFFAEAADRIFFEQQRDDELWEFFISLLEELDIGEDIGIKEFLRMKQKEFLGILGYAPNLSECAFCSSPITGKLTAYSPEAKGGICSDCFLNGGKGIILKDPGLSGHVLEAIYEGIVENKLYSLNLIRTVLKSR